MEDNAIKVTFELNSLEPGLQFALVFEVSALDVVHQPKQYI